MVSDPSLFVFGMTDKMRENAEGPAKTSGQHQRLGKYDSPLPL